MSLAFGTLGAIVVALVGPLWGGLVLILSTPSVSWPSAAPSSDRRLTQPGPGSWLHSGLPGLRSCRWPRSFTHLGSSHRRTNGRCWSASARCHFSSVSRSPCGHGIDLARRCR